MKALTLWQPWASLVGPAKTIETRGWYTNYRGPIAIHAANTNVGFRVVKADSDLQNLVIATLGPDWRSLPLGSVIATAF